MENGGVQSVERTFQIIEILAENANGFAFTEICQKSQLHKSTVHRLLATLIRLGYAAKDTVTGNYRLTLKLFEKSNRLVNNIDIISLAKPHLDRLNELTKEVVHLVMPLGISDVVYVYKIDAVYDNQIRMASRLGASIPMYCSAVGKAIMAFLPRNEAETIWDHTDVRQLTPNTITSRIQFFEHLDAIRAQGYAIDNEENQVGVWCFAIPLIDFRGRPCAAFSVSAPIMRIHEEERRQISDHALTTGRAIMRDISYVGA